MIAKASAIQHGQAMTNYATKNNRADIVKTNLLNEGLPPMGMWDEMVLHQSMFKQRYAKKPIELTSIRFELSPSEEGGLLTCPAARICPLPARAGKRIPPNASPTARSCWRSTRWAPTFC